MKLRSGSSRPVWFLLGLAMHTSLRPPTITQNGRSKSSCRSGGCGPGSGCAHARPISAVTPCWADCRDRKPDRRARQHWRAEVARSAPDGYTLLMGTNTTQAANVAMLKNLPTSGKGLRADHQDITTAMVLLVKPDFPAKNLAQFMEYAPPHPNNNAGYGSGASQISIGQLQSRGACPSSRRLCRTPRVRHSNTLSPTQEEHTNISTAITITALALLTSRIYNVMRPHVHFTCDPVPCLAARCIYLPLHVQPFGDSQIWASLKTEQMINACMCPDFCTLRYL